MKKFLIIIMVVLIIGLGFVAWSWGGDGKIKEEESSFLENTNNTSSTDTWQVYENTAHAFLFRYPETLAISEFTEGKAEVVFAQDSVKLSGFQIYILPWDEGADAITPERIKQDLPNVVLNNPQVARIGVNNIKALIFEGELEGLGVTREVWFVDDKVVYQVRAPKSFDYELSLIMNTWTFTD